MVEHPEHRQDQHQTAGDEGADGGVAGDGADLRPGEGRQQQATQGLATEERVALARDLRCGCLQGVDLGLRLAGVDGGLDLGLGGPLGCAEIGVGGALGDALQVAVDVAGVGLGAFTGGQLLAGEAEQVGPLLGGQLLGAREADVL